MKKILCALLSVLLLGGCSSLKAKEVEKKPLEVSGFNTTAYTELNGIKVSARVSYTQGASLSFVMNSPKTVSGLEITCADGEYKLEKDGITLSFFGEKLPFDMLCSSVENCLKNAMGKTPEEKNGFLVYAYNAGEHICSLYTEKESGAFVKLAVDGNDAVFFENFKFTY